MKKTKTRFTTLRALIQGFAAGEITPEEMILLLDQIEMGIALSKRDREVAEALQSAPDSIEEHPIYVMGYEAGYGAGFAEGKNPSPTQ